MCSFIIQLKKEVLYYNYITYTKLQLSIFKLLCTSQQTKISYYLMHFLDLFDELVKGDVINILRSFSNVENDIKINCLSNQSWKLSKLNLYNIRIIRLQGSCYLNTGKSEISQLCCFLPGSLSVTRRYFFKELMSPSAPHTRDGQRQSRGKSISAMTQFSFIYQHSKILFFLQDHYKVGYVNTVEGKTFKLSNSKV